MGDIIALRIANPSGRPPTGPGGAEILFFTGVRYERMESTESAGLRQEPRRRKTLPHRRRPEAGGSTSG